MKDGILDPLTGGQLSELLELAPFLKIDTNTRRLLFSKLFADWLAPGRLARESPKYQRRILLNMYDLAKEYDEGFTTLKA